MHTNRIIQEHWIFSEKKLQELSKKIDAVIEIGKYKDLCIMAIGAYGRREANTWSGIDLICIKGSAQEEADMAKTAQTTIDATLIDILDQLTLPWISPKMHNLESILNEPGTPRDHQCDSGSIKISLLTEGTPVYNNEFYDHAMHCIAAGYCTDYYQYKARPTPAFVIADIIRHWKTIQLKNLHNRKAYIHDGWAHIVNLKLIFNTKLACYSFIFLLLTRGFRLTESNLVEIAHMKPLERMYRLMEEAPETRTIAADIINQYTGFLALHNQSTESLMEYFKSERTRRDIYNSGEVHFSQKIVSLLQLLTSTNAGLLQYLIV